MHFLNQSQHPHIVLQRMARREIAALVIGAADMGVRIRVATAQVDESNAVLTKKGIAS